MPKSLCSLFTAALLHAPLTALLHAPLTALHAAAAKPNIVFIFADDWGFVARLSKLALDWKATLPGKPNPDCISKEVPQPTQKKPPVDTNSEQ